VVFGFFGRLFLVSGWVSYPPGPILESVFPWRVSVDRNLPVYPGTPEIVDLGVWATPAAPKNVPKRGGMRPPPFGMVVGAAGASQTPKIGDFQPVRRAQLVGVACTH
jgi:hypothetical protein